MSATLVVAALAFALCASGCIGTTPDDRTREALGPDMRHPGPEHRAGQPCLLCHSERGGDSPYFSVAGTVYDLDGVTGREGIQVILVDATGNERTEWTNSVGNFMVWADDWSPAFPLSADVTDGDNRIGMRSPISIDGSCSACHTGALSATSVGRVVVGAFP